MNSQNTKQGVLSFSLALIVLLAPGFALAQTYVDADATGANNGSSWADAYTHLSDALLTPGPVEIWVAAGTYQPDPAGSDVTASFAVLDGQAVYGGFAGTETARSQRDPLANPTILSGDLAGDDLPGFLNNADNSYHIVTITNAGSGTVLDGFIITHGSAREASGADSQGGAIVITNSSPAITNCRFFDNFGHVGGGIVVVSGTANVTGCTFQQNWVQNGRGGAVYASGNTTLTIDDCVFEDNRAEGNAGANDGGALYVDLNTTATVTRSAFVNNSAQSANRFIAATGGAISSLSDNLTVANCLFRGHTSNSGGAVYNSGDATYINCVFNGNRSIVGGANAADTGGFGGAMFNLLATVDIIGCTFTHNTGTEAGGIYNGPLGVITIVNSIFWENSDNAGTTKNSQYKGPGTFTETYSCVQNLFTPIAGEDPPNPADFPGCFDTDPGLVDRDGPDNIPGSFDDNLRPAAGSLCIDAGDNTPFPAWVTTDLDGNARYFNDPGTVDTGNGTPPIVDIGPYEFVTGANTGTISVNSGAAITGTPAVTLSLSATGPNVTQMRFSNYGVTWSAWQPYATSSGWMLDPTDGLKTVYVQYGNASGVILASAVDTIVLDTLPPVGSIVINGGAEYTNALQVTLSLNATDAGSGVSEMRLSNDGVTWNAWEAHTFTKNWDLPSSDGLKTVYVQYRDAFGNTSGVSSDTITLDTVAPTGTLLINGGAVSTTSTGVTLTFSSTDDRSGVTELRLSNNGTTWLAWEAYKTSRAWGLTPGDGLKTVYVQYRDAAGNISVTASDQITLMTTSPAATVDAHTTPQTDLVLPDWNDTEPEKMTVLRFRISDPGFDGLPTLVDRIAIAISGTAGQAANDIAWAELHDDTSRVALASSIDNAQIVFGAVPDANGVAGLTAIADGTYLEFTVFIYLNTTLLGVNDQTYTFDIDETSVDVDSVGSTPMATDSGGVLPVVGTLFITQLSIAVTPNTWVIGPQTLSAVVESGVYIVTNNGNVAEDFSVSGGNGAGGWTLQPAPGTDAFRVEVDRTADGIYESALTTTDQALVSNVAAGGASTTLRLRYSTPTTDTIGAGVAQDFVILFKASRHVP